MADKLMYIFKDDKQNYLSCRLKLVVEKFELSEQTNQNSQKPHKLLSQQIRKRYYKTLGTSEINSPLFSLSLRYWSQR